MRRRLPAFVPDGAGPEHRVELRPAGGLDRGVVEVRAHANIDGARLRVPLKRLRRLDAEHIEDRGTRPSRGGPDRGSPRRSIRPGRPRDDARVAGSAVELVTLPASFEARVAPRHRPPVADSGCRSSCRRVRRSSARFWARSSGDAVGELHLVDRAVGPSLAAGPVWERTPQIDGVLEQVSIRLQVVEQAPIWKSTCTRNRRTPRPSAHEEPLLVVVQRHGRVTSSIGNVFPSAPCASPDGLTGG